MAKKPDSTIEEQAIDLEEAPASEQSVDKHGAGTGTALSEPEVDPVEELEKARQHIAASEDRFLRQAADFQNFRKRAIEDRGISVEIGRTQLALPMIDVLDDLRRSLEAVQHAGNDETNGIDALSKGVKLVFEKFSGELAKLGIKPMEVVGQPFDEQHHEAMMQQPAPEGTEPGTVIAEIQKGYTMGDKVLRHARVVVAT